MALALAIWLAAGSGWAGEATLGSAAAQSGRYFGAVIKVARGGKVGLETAIGDEGGPGTKPLGTCWKSMPFAAR